MQLDQRPAMPVFLGVPTVLLLVAAAAVYYFMPSQIVDLMSTMQSVVRQAPMP